METILVPTDFSEAASNSLNYAIELAKTYDAEIVLVNAYPTPIVTETGLPLTSVPVLHDLACESLEDLKKKIQKNNGEITITCYAEMGLPFDVIEQASKKYGASAVVIGIIGEAGAFKEKLIGSTATKVARQLSIPTFIIPDGVKYKTIQKMAFSCDFSNIEKSTLPQTLKYFAKLFNAELDILHIEKPGEEISEKKSKSIKYLEQALGEIKHRTVFITDPNIGAGIEDYTKNHNEDLMITNPKNHGVLYYLFHENVTKELAFHLHLPILAIHSH